MQNTIIKNITRNVDSTRRILVIHADSHAIISNLHIETIRLGVISVTDSVMEIYDSYMGDVVAEDSVIDVYTSNDVVIDNFTTFDWTTSKQSGMIAFRSSSINLIRDSHFELSQPTMMELSNTNVTLATNITLDGIYKGLRVRDESRITLTNSIIKNMIQNIKEGDVLQSDITSSGSAIGK